MRTSGRTFVVVILPALLTGVLAFGVIVAGMPSPASPRLTGEAPAPASVLSLWYRAPASDHPLLPPDAPRQDRPVGTAKWVRALPVGNGRLGACLLYTSDAADERSSVDL